jgi:hypothetical protein
MREQPQDQAKPDDDHDIAQAAADKRTPLPEERAAGLDDPPGQAEAVLEESVERTEDVDPDAGHQTRRRSSGETVERPT